MYYFLPIPTQNSQSYTAVGSPSSPENLCPSTEADVLRCYTTASTIITRTVDLDETTKFLHYLPHFTVRPIAHAISVFFRVIRSNLPLRYPQIVVSEEAAKVSAHTVTVSRRLSAVEGELAWRLARCVELWNVTSAPYLAAAAAATAANTSNTATGHDNENNNDSDQAALAGAGLDYEPVLVERSRQRMVAALGFDFMIRWKNKYGPVHMGPYGPQPQTQNSGMQVGAGEAGGHTGHQQQALLVRSTGTSGPVDSRCPSTATGLDDGPTRLQAAHPDHQRFQSQQQQQQQTSMQVNVSGATMPPIDMGLSLPSVEMMDMDPLLGTDWGFLDDFGWGFDIQAR
jgi:transcriptional regulatory protein LEU3